MHPIAKRSSLKNGLLAISAIVSNPCVWLTIVTSTLCLLHVVARVAQTMLLVVAGDMEVGLTI